MQHYANASVADTPTSQIQWLLGERCGGSHHLKHHRLFLVHLPNQSRLQQTFHPPVDGHQIDTSKLLENIADSSLAHLGERLKGFKILVGDGAMAFAFTGWALDGGAGHVKLR